jgi:hypothetical protein
MPGNGELTAKNILRKEVPGFGTHTATEDFIAVREYCDEEFASTE